MLLLRDAVAKPSLAYHGGFYMPRHFSPPLVEPGVYIKPKGIQKFTGVRLLPNPGTLFRKQYNSSIDYLCFIAKLFAKRHGSFFVL